MASPSELQILVTYKYRTGLESLWRWTVRNPATDAPLASGQVWSVVPFSRWLAKHAAERTAKKIMQAVDETYTLQDTNLSKLEARTAELERLLDIQESSG